MPEFDDAALKVFAEWLADYEARLEGDFSQYVRSIAVARYVIRRVGKITDEQARVAGLTGLQHQALIQIVGCPLGYLSVRGLAERVDIVPALASRIATELETLSLIERVASEEDRRMIYLYPTPSALRTLSEVSDRVLPEVEYFQRHLTDADRLAALVTFAFYIGLKPDSGIGLAIKRTLEGLPTD